MDDLIKRQDAIDAIRASALKYTGFMEMEMYTDNDAVEAIESLPSAQPEVLACGEGELKESEQWIPYSVEDGTVTIDVSSISDKIRGCRIELYFGKEEEKDGC